MENRDKNEEQRENGFLKLLRDALEKDLTRAKKEYEALVHAELLQDPVKVLENGMVVVLN